MPRKRQTSMRCTACGSTFGTDARRRAPPPPAARREVVPFSTHVVLWCPVCNEPNGWSTRGRPNQIPALKAYALRLAKEFAKDHECGLVGEVQCVTCGRWMNRTQSILNAGHCLPRLDLAGGWYYDRRCIHCQCARCNAFESGKQREYEMYMRTTYGDELFDRILNDKKHCGDQVTVGLLREIIATYDSGQPWMMSAD